MKDIKKTQTELQYIKLQYLRLKHALDWNNDKLDIGDEKTNAFEDIAVKTIQKKHIEKKDTHPCTINKASVNCRKTLIILVSLDLESLKQKKLMKTISKEIMDENFPNSMKTINLLIQ